MAFQKFKREDQMVARMRPYITLREKIIAFNSVFFTHATLDQYTHVNILVDSDNYKIGFIVLVSETGKNQRQIKTHKRASILEQS